MPSSENQFCSRIKPLIKFAPKTEDDPKIKIELALNQPSDNSTAKLAETAAAETDGGVKGIMAYQMYPLGKNKILVRFENLADRFDTNVTSEDSTTYIDLERFAHQLYTEANP